jgi:peptidoglycan/xylan/chitin deacetylase (PgdA/CDA1 family)
MNLFDSIILIYKRKRYIINIPLLFVSIVLFGQRQDTYKAEIATWYQDKEGAISVSFDDASYTQYITAYPVLEKNGIKATFSIVGEWIEEEPAYKAEVGFFDIKRMGWQQVLEMCGKGHELASHGYVHEKYDKQMPVQEITDEMIKNKTFIESKINSPVYTLHYPYSYASGNIPLAAKAAGFLFGRTGLDTINASSPADMYLLASHSILNENNPDSITFQNWISQAKGNWLILMYHHLFENDSKEMQISRSHNVEYSYSIPPALFEKQIDAVATSGCWVAPISSVGKYITERNGTEVRTIKDKDRIVIYTITNLDKAVYNQPMTLKVDVPWKKVKVEGSLHDGIVEIRNGYLLIDLMLEEEIIIEKQ